MLQLLGDCPQTPYRGFAPGPHWGTDFRPPDLLTLDPQSKISSAAPDAGHLPQLPRCGAAYAQKVLPRAVIKLSPVTATMVRYPTCTGTPNQEPTASLTTDVPLTGDRVANPPCRLMLPQLVACGRLL